MATVDRPMRILEHLEELRQRLMKAFAAFLVFFVLFFSFSLQIFQLGVVPLPYPFPSPQNPMAAQFLRTTMDYLVPADVNRVFLSPPEGFVVILKTGAFLSVIFSAPVWTYELGKFVAPALKPSEKRLILRLTAPATVLFILGVLFGFFYVLPFAFDFLYGVAPALGAQPYLQVDQFPEFVLLFILGFGLAFELPLIMKGVTYLGVVTPEFWKRHWRFSVLAIFVFGAVITPDGSGVTMLMVSFPMLFLYLLGMLLSKYTRTRTEIP